MKKKFISLVLVILLIGLFVIGCSSTQTGCMCGCDCSGGTPCSGATKAVVETVKGAFSSIATGKDWKLVQVQVSDAFSREVLFNRNTLSKENAGNIFILRFTADRLSGTAAPNTYSGSYTVNNSDRTISVQQPMTTTQMASIWQPEKLREQHYYAYLHNANKWDVVGGKLLIYSKAADGKDILLTFE